MTVLTLVLLIVGAVCFAIATINAPNRFNLVSLGLLAWILVPLIHTIRALGH